MSITIENLPIFFLLFVGIGVGIVFIGILRLAALHEDEGYYINMNKEDHSTSIEELFSYFLQEEEKKNQNFREMMRDVSKDPEQLNTSKQQLSHSSKPHVDKQIFNEIIERYQAGESIEDIARNLKKGIGEVKLVISLYSMR